MDRMMVYPGAIPLETDLLNSNRFALIGLAKLAAAVLGTATLVNGLACTPNSPAALNVLVAPGEIYSLVNLDGTAYSSLSADTTHQVVKQGISMDTVTLSCPAPVTAGYSVNYLVEAAYLDSDTNAVVLPYYNAANPSMAYSGPSNTGASNNTTRKGVCSIQVKAGTAATTGSQVTPAPDSGYTGLFVVTVANGQSTITAGNIAQVSGSPFMPAGGLIAGGLQGSLCNIASAGGAADVITAAYTPGITALTNGMSLYVRAALANATTTPTLNVNGLGAKTIYKGAGAALAAGDIAGAGHWVEFQYDSTLAGWVLLNPATGVTSVSRQIQPISASVASNALTVNLASTTLDFRSATLTSGAVTSALATGALSLTVPSGATLGTVSGQLARIAILVANNAGAPVLCVCNGLQVDESALISPTTISSGATALGTIYSASAVSANSPFRVVGFVEATEATAGTWATAPSLVQGMGGQAQAAVGLGYGQTWQSVTRVVGTTYYNTTGRPILVNVTATPYSGVWISTNGLTVGRGGASNSGIGTFYWSAVAIIPPGQSYSFGGNIDTCAELR